MVKGGGCGGCILNSGAMTAVGSLSQREVLPLGVPVRQIVARLKVAIESTLDSDCVTDQLERRGRSCSISRQQPGVGRAGMSRGAGKVRRTRRDQGPKAAAAS